MEGSLTIFSYDKSLKVPTTPSNSNKINSNFIQSQEKKLHLGRTLENKGYFEAASGLKIASSRVPRNSINYLNDLMQKRQKKPEMACRPIIKIVEKSDLDFLAQPKKAQRKLVISPERLLLLKHKKNQPAADISYSRHSESFDSTWESITASNKQADKNYKVQAFSKKIVPRQTPARFLPISEVKLQRPSIPNHAALVNLKKDLKLLIENNYEKMYKVMMVEKMSRNIDKNNVNCGILKRKEEDKWGWNTPLYSPREKKAVHFDYN